MTEGSFLVGDFQSAAIYWDRQSITVEAGYQNTDFTQNQITVLAEMRGALTVVVPDALVSGALTV